MSAHYAAKALNPPINEDISMTAATTTAKTTKAPNYTDEQTAAIKAAYLTQKAEGKPNKDIAETLATQFAKSARSIVAKLTKEGVYKKDTYVSKTGEPVLKKDDAADAIGRILKLTPEEADSLAKANKSALKKVLAALAESKPIDGTDTAKAMASPQGWAEVEADNDAGGAVDNAADAAGYGNADESREG